MFTFEVESLDIMPKGYDSRRPYLMAMQGKIKDPPMKGEKFEDKDGDNF
jgi:hypothetical protein